MVDQSGLHLYRDFQPRNPDARLPVRGVDFLVDRTIGLVDRCRGPDHCVVNVLDTVVPEGVIFYLFFFYFSWAIAGPVLEMEAVDHHACQRYQHLAFFWPPQPPTTPHHRAPPCGHSKPTMGQPYYHGTHTVISPHQP